MKKLLIIYLMLFNHCFAQIQLEQNIVLPKNGEKLSSILNMGKYYANIVAYAMMCKFSQEDNKLVYQSYFQLLEQYNLNNEDFSYIKQNYELEFQSVINKNKQKNEKELYCEKFKQEFDKIVEYIKK